jgi:hypothetical protein
MAILIWSFSFLCYFKLLRMILCQLFFASHFLIDKDVINYFLLPSRKISSTFSFCWCKSIDRFSRLRETSKKKRKKRFLKIITFSYLWLCNCSSRAKTRIYDTADLLSLRELTFSNRFCFCMRRVLNNKYI